MFTPSILLRILIVTLVGLLLYFLLYRIMRKGSRQAGLVTMWIAEPFTVLFGSGAAEPLHANPRAKPFREALSPESLEQARNWLCSLKPGAEFEIPFREAPHPRSGKPILFADGWIGDYSGRNLQGCRILGQPTALVGDTVYGTHLFGWLRGHHVVVPACQLITRARAVWGEAAPPVENQDFAEVGSIWLEGGQAKLYAGAPVVHEVLTMEETGEGEDGPEKQIELVDDPAKVEALFKAPLTPERYRNAERELPRLPLGCRRWEMIGRLEGRLITLQGYDAVMHMDGYLNFIGTHRWSKITPRGIFLAQPFGVLEENREVPRQVAVFLNDRFYRLCPFSSREEQERELGI